MMTTETWARERLSQRVTPGRVASLQVEKHEGGWWFFLPEDAPRPALGDITEWVVLDDGTCRPVRKGTFAEDIFAEHNARA